MWTLDQAWQFAATAAADERFGPLWLVYLELGCRRGEGLGLRWIDLDQKKRAISIRQAVVRARTEVTVKGTKGKRSRTLEVSDELLLALRRFELARRAIEEIARPFAAPGRAPLTGPEREEIRRRLSLGGDFRFEAGRRIRFERRAGLLTVRSASAPTNNSV